MIIVGPGPIVIGPEGVPETTTTPLTRSIAPPTAVAVTCTASIQKGTWTVYKVVEGENAGLTLPSDTLSPDKEESPHAIPAGTQLPSHAAIPSGHEPPIKFSEHAEEHNRPRTQKA